MSSAVSILILPCQYSSCHVNTHPSVSHPAVSVLILPCQYSSCRVSTHPAVSHPAVSILILPSQYSSCRVSTHPAVSILNHRGISLISTVAKTFSSIINKRLADFL